MHFTISNHRHNQSLTLLSPSVLSFNVLFFTQTEKCEKVESLGANLDEKFLKCYIKAPEKARKVDIELGLL